MYQNKTANKLQQLARLGFNDERMDDFYHIFMESEYQAQGLNDISFGKQSLRDDNDLIYVPSLINQNYQMPCCSAQMNNEWYISIPSYCEYCFDCDGETQSKMDSRPIQKKKWLPAGKKADKSDPELQNLSNSYFWERRNILLQMLESYTDDQAVLITATEKSTKKVNGKVVTKRPRGSLYRGVSKNKSKWQVMIMGNFKKMYFGAIEDEKEAALFYDKLAIISHGIKARTNFNYTRSDIINILNEEGLSRVWSQ